MNKKNKGINTFLKILVIVYIIVGIIVNIFLYGILAYKQKSRGNIRLKNGNIRFVEEGYNVELPEGVYANEEFSNYNEIFNTGTGGGSKGKIPLSIALFPYLIYSKNLEESGIRYGNETMIAKTILNEGYGNADCYNIEKINLIKMDDIEINNIKYDMYKGFVVMKKEGLRAVHAVRSKDGKIKMMSYSLKSNAESEENKKFLFKILGGINYER